MTGAQRPRIIQWGRWHQWTGQRWREDGTLRAFNLIRALCKAEGVKLKSMSAIVSAVHTLARADPLLAAEVEQWDADPWLLNTPGGIVDLKTGDMRKPDPTAYCSKMTAVGPRGDCPLFKRFIDRIMGGDAALVAFVQRALGYGLTGDTSEQVIFFNYGVGQNGKTVLMSTAAGVLGDYCLATPIETFTEARNDRHPTELARLRGARLVIATETEAGRHWAESRLKELTGGERIPARFMHKDFFEYLLQFKPWISGNHRPRLRSVGVAMRRRVRMIPFLVTIPQEECDPQLADKLKDERPGILQWMIDGCLEWQERGLAAPESRQPGDGRLFRWRGRLFGLDCRSLRSDRGLLGAIVQAVRVMARLGREGWPTAWRHQDLSRGNRAAGFSAQAQ
jgi:putative DNA primase/helicase